MGELRDYYVEDLDGFVDFETSTPCPKLPARILLDDFVGVISLNIREGYVDCYTQIDYPPDHHLDINPGQNSESRGILKEYCKDECAYCPDRIACSY
jgi:hypothetical protein